MLLWLAGTACSVPDETDGDTDVRVPATPDVTPGVDKTAYVRLMNHVWDRYGANPEVGLDVKVPPTNPITLISDFPTGANSGYVDLFDPGTYEIGLYDDNGLLLDVGDVGVQAGGFYTLDVFGIAGFGVVGSQMLQDDPSLPSTGMARLHVVHTATGVPTFDVWTGGSKVSDDVAYGAVSADFEIAIGSFSIGYDLTQDGNPDVTCVGVLSADSFLPGTPPVLHAVVAPSATTYLGAMYIYIFGGADTPQAQVPIVAPCHLGP
jgi:hypothetical protein